MQEEDGRRSCQASSVMLERVIAGACRASQVTWWLVGLPASTTWRIEHSLVQAGAAAVGQRWKEYSRERQRQSTASGLVALEPSVHHRHHHQHICINPLWRDLGLCKFVFHLPMAASQFKFGRHVDHGKYCRTDDDIFGTDVNAANGALLSLTVKSRITDMHLSVF